ncbi:MAG: efflux RND transporter periplasmic adaptor subunit, partial [Flavobacteriales bacterium]
CLATGVSAAALIAIVMVAGCSSGDASNSGDTNKSRTPVTVTQVRTGSIQNTVTLNATARFLRKNTVRSTVNGRVERANIALGDHVVAGRTIYVLRTKEAEALGALAARDSTFRIGGSITINAPASGIAVQVDKLLNDYVNDGDQLAVIADASSSVFLMQVPYELAKSAHVGAKCMVLLPDSSTVPSTIATPLSLMDSVSQTQRWVVRPNGSAIFPEGLTGTVRITVDQHAGAQILPASCVLGNEEMTKFWVMHLVNDSTAVKVPVQRGIVTHDSVEVSQPQFAAGDRILLTGGYGLPDTANVIITH